MTFALGAAAAIVAALVLSPQARAQQTDDSETLEQALADVYTAEPADPASLRGIFERLKVRQQRNFRIEAGLAIAEASISIATDDRGAAERAREAGEKTAALNPDHRLSRRAQGMGYLAAARLEDRKRDRRTLLEKAVRAFDYAMERATPEKWLDAWRRASALRELGRTADAVKGCDVALKLLDEPNAAAFGAGGKPRAKALVTAEKARCLVRAGSLGDALPLLQAAVEASPGDATLRAELGFLQDRRGLTAEAREALAAAIATTGEGALPARRRTEAALALGRAEVAGASATAALAALEPLVSETGPAEALALRGALRRIAGRPLDAQADTAEALTRDGFAVEARATRVQLLLDHMSASMATGSADATEALEGALACAALEPRSARRAQMLVDALRAAGREKDAEAAAEKARALAEAATARVTEGKEHPADTALALARRAESWGRDDEALEAAVAALAADPEDGAAQVIAARAHMKITPPHTAEARAAAAALVKRFPAVHDAHTLAAQAALLAGDAPAARAAAQQAAQLDPRDVAAQRIISGATEQPAGASSGAAPVRKLPPELADAAKRFGAADPITRAEAGAQLMADPTGAEMVLSQLERDPDPYVVGALANVLSERGERRASPALRRMLHALPTSQPVARGRVLRALGKLGDSTILPEVLEAVMEGAAESGDAGHAAVLSLMSGMEETSAVIFQRELVESTDDLRKALAPVLADHLVKDRIAHLEAEGRAASGAIATVRGALLGLLALIAYVRFRFWQREQQLRAMAEAQSTRRKKAGTGSFSSKAGLGEGGSQTGT